MSGENERNRNTQAAGSIPDGWSIPMPERTPAPGYWPAALALGVVMLLLGVVTSFVISGVGLFLMAVSLTKWIGELVHGR